METRICPNQDYAKIIIVRCRGCNSLHATKNIGTVEPDTKIAHLHRRLSDTMGCTCMCDDPGEHPVLHDCSIDDHLHYECKGFDPFSGKHYADTEEARQVLMSWWVRLGLRKLRHKYTEEEIQEEAQNMVTLREQVPA